MKISEADILIAPGLGNSGPDHWQQRWSGRMSTARLIKQADWDRPELGEWVETIHREILLSTRPVVLVGHSLAVAAIVHTAQLLVDTKVRGAFLVSPVDFESAAAPAAARGFAPVPTDPLPFPSMVVASTTDPLVSVERAQGFAADWGSRLQARRGRRPHQCRLRSRSLARGHADVRRADEAPQIVTRTLFLIRHAKSAWDEPALADFDRPLSKRGAREADELRTLFAASGYAPDLILCSTAQRTRETLAAMLGALARDTRIILSRALYAAPAERLLGEVHRVEPEVETLAIVGHNPGLEDFAKLLAGDGEAAVLRALAGRFPPAGVAVIEFPHSDWAGVEPGSGRLVAFHTPAA